MVREYSSGKTAAKLQKKTNINKLNYKIMKKIICSLVSFDDVLHLHIGYKPIILPENSKMITSFNVSDVFLHFDSNISVPNELLPDFKIN